jgi:hypothetical protein
MQYNSVQKDCCIISLHIWWDMEICNVIIL